MYVGAFDPLAFDQLAFEAGGTSGAFDIFAFDEYAFHVDYTQSSALFVSIAGVQRAEGRTDETAKILYGSLQVVDVLNETPNTCKFRTIGFAPLVGQRVIIALGGPSNPSRLFAGTILTCTEGYIGTPDFRVWDVDCVDDTWKLGQILVTKRYSSQSATAIAEDLIDTYAPDFTPEVEASLPTVDEITFTNEPLATCLTRLAKRIGGYWKPGEFEEISFFITNTDTDPEDLADLTPPLQAPHTQFSITRDIGNMITRVIGEGGGAEVLSDIDPGYTTIPLRSVEYFNTLGGEFVSGPQRCSYSSIVEGGGGGLVGPGAAPSSAPAVALAGGAGVTTGAHLYGVTFVTAAGESIPGPTVAITTGAIDPPSTAPIAGSPSAGTGVTVGSHEYAVTFVTAGGETTSSPISSAVTILDRSAPSVAPTFALVAGTFTTGHTPINASMKYSWIHAGGAESLPSSASGTVAIGVQDGWQLSGIAVGPSGVTARRIYITYEEQGSPGVFYTRCTVINDNTTTSVDCTTAFDTPLIVLDFVASPQTVDPTHAVVGLTQIPLGPAATTSRKLYRTEAGGSQMKLLDTIGNNTATTYSDSIADGSLGANIPVVNGATANQVSLSAIPIGGAGVTDRKIYRTVAAGSTLKLVATIADNSTTTYTDSTADGSLGADAPASDTSGLTQPTGQVLPGATSVPMTNIGAMSTAGWAVIGNGQQVIRYTGKSSTSLTGVPASGIGAITAAIAYNSTITAAPMLTGIPSSGDGEILYALVKGDPVNLLIVEDDFDAQNILSDALEDADSGVTHDGVVETFIQDRRLTETEIRARAQAVLALRAQVDASIVYAKRDRDTRSGTTIAVDLTDYNVDDSFKIQRVTIHNFQPALDPVYDVEASTSRFSFEDLLRLARGGAV